MKIAMWCFVVCAVVLALLLSGCSTKTKINYDEVNNDLAAWFGVRAKPTPEIVYLSNSQLIYECNGGEGCVGKPAFYRISSNTIYICIGTNFDDDLMILHEISHRYTRSEVLAKGAVNFVLNKN